MKFIIIEPGKDGGLVPLTQSFPFCEDGGVVPLTLRKVRTDMGLSVTHERCKLLMTIAPVTDAKMGPIRVRSGKTMRIKTFESDDELGIIKIYAAFPMVHSLVTPPY
ncbi:hypothetical protein PIB30_088766 [Stylosanthes scabra]|uniref:Uncharacterized protein n=1 Tax=Stylosanthes scabra TaxID=79078 RepID=A0ABU6UXI8_9FABA|nr:hypothetical protein [Stylosanthes scabra]